MYFVLFKVVIHVFCSSQADLQMIIGNIMHAHYAAQILFMNVIFGSIIGVFGKLREKVSRPDSGCEPFVFVISTASSHLCTEITRGTNEDECVLHLLGFTTGHRENILNEWVRSTQKFSAQPPVVCSIHFLHPEQEPESPDRFDTISDLIRI